MKKIIAIVTVIATITAILCIGANAVEIGEIIPTGAIIEMPTAEEYAEIGRNSNLTIHFKVQGKTNDFNKIVMANSGTYVNYQDGVEYGTRYPLAVVENGAYTNETYRTITLTQDLTIDSSNYYYFNDSKITMPIIQNTLNNTKATFSTTLTVATAIIAWLMANQIALVGLYIYILVVLLATGKRYIKGV